MENNVLFLPYLTGDKYIYQNPELCGVFYNLTINSSQLDMTISVMEGVSFALKLLLKVSDNTYIKDSLLVMGGGSKNEIWMKIISNTFNSPLFITEESITAVHGAIIIGFLSKDKSIKFKKVATDIVSPEISFIKHYESKFRQFTMLSNTVNDLNIRLNNM